MTGITQRVVDACGLKPFTMTKVSHAGGVSDTEVYMVNIALPNAVALAHVPVIRSILGDGPQVLIGMDVITRGDFSVTNNGGLTVFSFRLPSQHTVDFVAESKKQQRTLSGAGGFSGGRQKGHRHKGRL